MTKKTGEKNSKYKICNICGKSKSIIFFGAKRSDCSICQRSRKLFNYYGINSDEYERLLLEQNNKCACCLSSNAKNRHNRFVVDHCHDTGKVRGLLCDKCNTGIGSLSDSLEGILQAVAYLKRFEHASM